MFTGQVDVLFVMNDTNNTAMAGGGVIAATAAGGPLPLDAAFTSTTPALHCPHTAPTGAPATPTQLLALQADVLRHAQQLELASRLVDKLAGAVKQTLQTQV